jgi:23S rRNA pseudouridine1911/1915/1917 synthase
MAVRPGGRVAVTHYEVLERYAGTDGKPVASLLDCRLETGRTHQIRVHLAAIGHPLLGDDTYGAGYRNKAALLPEKARDAVRLATALHAYLLGLEHRNTRQQQLYRSALLLI